MMQYVGILGLASAFSKKLLMRDFDSERYIAGKKQKDEDFREKWKVLWRKMTSDLNSRIGIE